MIYIGYEHPNDEVLWKKIYWKNGEETNYSVANIGLVRNDLTGKLMKISYRKDYGRLHLCHKGQQKEFFIHILVARAFIPNPEHKPQVNHKDGDKHHNYDTNLEWTTGSENVLHAFRTGLNKWSGYHAPLTTEQIEKICEMLQNDYGTFSAIARVVGTSRETVSAIYNRQSRTNISSKYDFSNYHVRKTVTYDGDDNARTLYPDSKIIEVCELIDQGSNTLRQISKLTEVDYQTVRNVYYGSCRTSISSKYNFRKVSENPLYEKKKALAIKICELLDEGYNTKEVSEMVGSQRSMVRNIMAGTTWKDISKDYNFMKNKKRRK